ncbi:MAG: SPOR domain-containing protein [Bacteroidales bacterium]|jgi:hypothetical protein|nr:SPOR domain-containing protein [Bacteroidales bacterium]
MNTTNNDSTIEPSVKAESIRRIEGEDATGLNRFSFVIGSFRNMDNAVSQKEWMVKDGYKPLIVENSNGFLRVIVESFATLAEAKDGCNTFKAKYMPSFWDAWILERTNSEPSQGSKVKMNFEPFDAEKKKCRELAQGLLTDEKVKAGTIKEISKEDSLFEIFRKSYNEKLQSMLKQNVNDKNRKQD